jgi:hypothetical protein
MSVAATSPTIGGVATSDASRVDPCPPELIGRVASTRAEGMDLRGVVRFPVERHADKIHPSADAAETSAGVS